jgi:hypothetical protein
MLLPSAERLSRVVKLAIDSGEVGSLEEARALFASYRVRIRVGPNVVHSRTLQAALLTAVNTGRRCFLGGVGIDAPPSVVDAPLVVDVPGARSLGNALSGLGALVHRPEFPPAPEIWIGDVDDTSAPDHPIAVRCTFEGWRSAVVTLDSDHRLNERGDFTPAGVMAGALAVSEVFQHLRGDTVDAGVRDLGISLWSPEPTVDWRISDGAPTLTRLPSRLWILGLGHLGQAYLWTLGLLPYLHPNEVSLVLQDIDTLEEANDSTSVLTNAELIGRKKTRAMAEWAESRGFKSTIVEREFAANFKVGANDPRMLLGGVDNPLARAQLELAGFARVIDAGLGAGTREFLALQLHSFPSHARPASDLWGARVADDHSGREVLDRPGYRALADAGADECGLTMLAGRTVGAPFVGAITGSLVIAEAIRTAIGVHSYAVIDANLRGLAHRQAIRNELHLEPMSLGLTPVRKTCSVR